MLAAHVSGLNSCGYCHGVHRQAAVAFGVEETLIERLLDDPDSAPVEPKLRPLLAYVRKVTLEPSKMTAADAQAHDDLAAQLDETPVLLQRSGIDDAGLCFFRLALLHEDMHRWSVRMEPDAGQLCGLENRAWSASVRTIPMHRDGPQESGQ